ncbi:hypothetical protein V1504DRAFT_463411 [Lipomyces starkeyi]
MTKSASSPAASVRRTRFTHSPTLSCAPADCFELLVQRITRGDSITSLLDDDGKISINEILDKLSVEAETDFFAGLKRSPTSNSSDSDDDERDQGLESDAYI